ncbi:hypothetical protein CMU95_03955 [Elizabethkingia anophelis]|nr:hypothetical protein [Elizabethkingia anophelis]MDV3475430.1 hypothetical protein [Elizabethkingia anophelis]MDV3994571.1 hypothetical protein [Elizabethkingia anophelis]
MRFQAHWGLFGRVPCPFFSCLLVGQGSGYALYLLFVNSQKDAAAIPHAEWCLTRKGVGFMEVYRLKSENKIPLFPCSKKLNTKAI